MKSLLWLAGIAFSFAACNNAQPTDTANTDPHANHEMHSGTASGTTVQNDLLEAMHKPMDDMMREMRGMKPTGDADYDFASLMKMHHQSAVEMAQVLVANGSDAEAKTHAQHTIEEQQREISLFDAFLEAHKPSGGRSDYGQKALDKMSAMSMPQMDKRSLETLYASMMIPHHQDGIDMAADYLKVGKNAELRRIAQSITQTQPKEIEDYKQWLSK